MQREATLRRMGPREAQRSTTLGTGLLGTAATVLGLLLLNALRVTGIWEALFLAPILLVASRPAFARQAAREHDPTLVRLLTWALVLKFLGAVVRYWVAFHVYGGNADSAAYHQVAVGLADQFRAGNFHTHLNLADGTDFISLFTGILYTIISPSIHAGFLLYSWLGFWGLFFFYRAFVVALPAGRRRSYARLVFFLPSLLYWPSSIGKEAWMLFSLGLIAFGTARVLSGSAVRGLGIAALGLYLGALVRPHVVGMAALALVAAFVLARPRRGRSWLRRFGRLIVLAGLVGLAALVLSQTASYLKHKGIDPQDGVSSTLAESQRRTSTGGSSFQAQTAAGSPAKLPQALVTILFRPFLFEAHNAQAAVTALESTVLLCLALKRARLLGRAVRSLRRQPYVTFVLAYTVLFAIVFSSIGNFGILARERVQVLPLFLVLLAVPDMPRPARAAAERRADGQLARA